MLPGADSFQPVFYRNCNRQTNKPIPFANVYFVELESGTTTDEDGIFTIEHYPKKGIHIQISFIGYKTTYLEIDLAVVSERESGNPSSGVCQAIEL